MAIRYFSDTEEGAVLLEAVHGMCNKLFAEKFPGIKGLRDDTFSKWVGYSTKDKRILPATRKIEYKTKPSLHECNAKCLNGRHNGICECRCGGENHGKGMFTKLLDINS